MNRSNVPSPIRTSVTPTAANGYDDSTTNNMMPTSAMRQGRFLSPENATIGGAAAAFHQQPQITSPSQVTFQPGAAPPQASSSTIVDNNINNNMTSNFMFDDMEEFQYYLQQPPHDPNSSPSTPTNNNSNASIIPTEAQLTLLCLDYLRSLRRSYQNPQDLFHGEGLHADYLSLAIWSLNRAFCGGHEKLAFGKVKVSRIEEDQLDDDGRKKKKKKKKTTVKEIRIVGGGGLAGVEDECVGNDSIYRLDVKKNQQQYNDDDDDSMMDSSNDNDDDGSVGPTKEVFALTETIKLPSMADITNEVLLSYNNNNSNATKNDECPIYEQNDLHLSNSHRFYLFNGMASGDDGMGMIGGGGGGANNATTAAAASMSPRRALGGPSIVDGGPLTLADLTSVALSTLNAKSRIEAEREVVQDPLFESFIKAAGEKGFFAETKLEGKTGTMTTLSPEEEERRQRLVYENKYRKVVAKFRSKLAVREEQQMLHVGGGGPWSPRSGQKALRNVHSVSDRLEMRRDRIIEHVKEYRVEEEDGASPFVPHLLSEQEQQEQVPVVGDVADSYEYEAQTSGNIAASSYDTDQQLAGDVAVSSFEYEQQTDVAASYEYSSSEYEQEQEQSAAGDVAASYEYEQQTVDVVSSSYEDEQRSAGDDVSNYEQFITQRSESEEGIQANVTAEERVTDEDVDRALAAARALVAAQALGAASAAPSSPSKEEIQADVTAKERMTEVERSPSPVEAPPPQVASPPSPPKTAEMDPPPSPDKAPKIPLSPAAKLPFYQEAENINAQGNELMQKKQFSQALELYTKALKISPAGPNSHVYYSNRSAAHLSLGDVESSIQDSQSALTIRPDYTKAHSRLGLAYYASGRYEEAVENYEAALGLDPGNEWVKRQYEKARKMLPKMQEEEEEVLENNGDWPSPFAQNTAIDEEAKRKEAQDIELLADEYKDRGNAFMKNKKFEEALQQYNLAIDTSAAGPNSHIYYSNRAAAYCYLRKYSEAADDCLSSIELNDSYEKAYSRYGLSLFFLGDYEGSIDAYRKSLELAPDNKASLSYLAKAKARLAEQQENEMQEDMAKKLNLGNEGNDDEIEQGGHGEGSFVVNNELSQTRDDEGEGVEASYNGVVAPGQFEKGFDPPGQTINAFDPFDSDEGDEI